MAKNETTTVKTDSQLEVRLELGRQAGYEVEALLGVLQREVDGEDVNLRYFVRSAVTRLDALNNAMLGALSDENNMTLEDIRKYLGGVFRTQGEEVVSHG